MTHADDSELAQRGKLARYCTENRHVTWVLLLATILLGIYGYATMPKLKDPDIPVRAAVALISWPGASAENIEERVTTLVEDKLSENSVIEKIESTTRSGVAVVTITLDKNVNDTAKVFDDLWLKLTHLKGLPDGASVRFVKDFGDTAALMLTVASPRASPIEIQLRGERVAAAILAARATLPQERRAGRVALVGCFPLTLDADEFRVVGRQMRFYLEARGAADARILEGPGFIGLDFATAETDAALLSGSEEFLLERYRAGELHPDVWHIAAIRSPEDAEAQLARVAGDKYSYRELDQYTDQLAKALKSVGPVAKVSRAGVLPDVVHLDFSQERLAAYNLVPSELERALRSRNIIARGGVMELEGKSVLISPAGELQSEQEIGGIIVARGPAGVPVYLRDLVTISRGYESPPSYLAFSTWRDARGEWQRTRAITVSLTMRAGLQISDLGAAVDARLNELRALLPEDLLIARVSDQPQQVRENVALFMSSLYEAIALVVLVALIGFWEWRSALLMALSIPITLAMTFAMMRLLGTDVQQVSIASLIIALGLLVDDPVVAGDAIKRELAAGKMRLLAAWLGPTRLAGPILFATLTNIVAYLPFLAKTGDSGRFIVTLPIVLTASLVASRLVSMTFVPMLGYVLLRAPRRATLPLAERKGRGFARLYSRVVGGAIEHRWLVLGGAVALLAGGAFAVSSIKKAFFPKDFSYLAYVDVWLAEDAPVASTRTVAEAVDRVARETLEEFGAAHPGADGTPRQVLESLTTFVGGGGPRFWFSLAPEQRQANYGQVVVRLRDKNDTAHVIVPLQRALSSRVPGARIDVRELESGPAVGIPVALRVSGEDPQTLRGIAARLVDILAQAPNAERVRDNWGADNFTVRLRVDPDRANLAGVTNADVARSSYTALNGHTVGTLWEGDHELSIVARLRASERQRLSDLDNLYVYSSERSDRVPLRQVATLDYGGSTAKIGRHNHARTITVSAFPVAGALPSEVVAAVRPAVDALRASLPPGYAIAFGGEHEKQQESFRELAVILLISVAAIFLALVVQFRSAVKPLIVFGAIPFGAVGGLLGLIVMRAPFGFMAFLGLISLIGVIVSHVIVLFDFIEERRTEGAPLRLALVDAGILRLRPVLITVGATVLGLIPLALHGGPLWEPLCYVQIAGLTIATGVTLLLVPVLYAIFVLDLRIVRWETGERGGQ